MQTHISPAKDRMTISLVGLSPLHALGLQAIISESYLRDEVIVPDMPSSADAWQSADCFIVSATALASFASFFMPRLSRILLLSSAPVIESERGLPVLSPLASRSEILSAISGLKTAAMTLSRHVRDDRNSKAEALPLTRRELEVMRLTARGAAAKEVASQLGISVNTVLTHRKNITDKLGIHGTPALIYFALKHQIL